MYTKLMLPFLCLIVMNLNGLEAMHLHNGKSDADSVAASMKLKGSESVRTLSNNPETAGAKNLPRNINQPINAGQVSRDIGSRISDSTISANSDNTANTGAGIVTHSARNEEHIGIDGHKHVHVTVLSEHSGNAQAVVQKQVMKAGEMLTSEHTTKDDRKSNTSETLDNIRTLGIDKVERLGTDHANTDTTNNVQTSQINKVEKISTGVAKSASIDTKTGVSKSASIDKQSATTSKTNNDPDDVVYHDYLDDLHNDNHGNEDLYHEVDMTATTKSTSAHVSTAGATSSSTTTITRSPASPTPTSTASSTTTSTTTATSTTTTTSRPTTTSFATTTTADTTTISPSTEPKPEDDVDPLGIFVGDITFQRFPKPMAMTAFKDKVLGNTYKKLYILEETPDRDKQLFGNVRQLESLYFMKNGSLYVDFLFRFIYSRKCTEINEYRLGYKAGIEELAMFAKETKNNQTERLVFFSDHPSDYLYLMSCTDMKTSPYACRGKYYVTLESSRDPPNSFKWLEASIELKNKMNLTFDDPRFMFNFVMTPCVWRERNRRRSKVT